MINYNFDITPDKILIRLECLINEKIVSHTEIIDNPDNLPETLNSQWLRNIKGDDYVNRLETQLSMLISISTPTDK